MKTKYKILSVIVLGTTFVTVGFGAAYNFSLNPNLGYVAFDDLIENLDEVKKFKDLYPEFERTKTANSDTGIAQASYSHFEHDVNFVYDGPNNNPNKVQLDIQYDLVTNSLLDTKITCTFNDETNIVSDNVTEYLSKDNCFKEDLTQRMMDEKTVKAEGEMVENEN